MSKRSKQNFAVSFVVVFFFSSVLKANKKNQQIIVESFAVDAVSSLPAVQIM